MDVARDIALIFLSLEALVMALIPLALLSGLAYAFYRLHRLARTYLRQAQVYVQKAQDFVEQASQKIAQPFIQAHATASMVATMFNGLAARADKLVRR